MNADFEQLVAEFGVGPPSTSVLQRLTSLLQSQTGAGFELFVQEKYQSLYILQQKIWQILSQQCDPFPEDLHFSEFFQSLTSFNKTLVFSHESIMPDMKTMLLMPSSMDQVLSILKAIEESADENNLLIFCVNQWFDNISFFIHEHPELGLLPVVIFMNQYMGKYVLSETFKLHLTQLCQPELSPAMFSQKQLFYMKTCPLLLSSYFYTNPKDFDSTHDEIIHHIGDEFRELVRIQSLNVSTWSRELLACMTHLMGFMFSFLWWHGEQGTYLKVFLPSEKVLCEFIEVVIAIISYSGLYNNILQTRSNDETILIDSILSFLVNILRTQNITWFFRSIAQLPNLLMKIAEVSIYYRIGLCAYGLLSEILTDDHIKGLTFPENKAILFFVMLEEAWRNAQRNYKQIPIFYFLRAFLNLSKNDFVQKITADGQKISLFVEMRDEFPIAYDIIWALSFNQDIQQQLRTNSTFTSKLVRQANDTDDEQMRKILQGICWNLNINQQTHSSASQVHSEADSFDVMISYSHKEKVLCKQIYDELVKANYRVWIDFDQMHGNVMDAMAQAIERSKIVILCMSEQYRKSSYCRAEAQYAFQQQRKIVPLLLQKHYKPDGWLLFLIGQLMYVDFTKYEFNRAMEMLHREMKMNSSSTTKETAVEVTDSRSSSASINIFDWNAIEVRSWLLEHNLVQLSRLFAHCDGRSLVYLIKYMEHCRREQILSLLEDESQRKLNEHISLVELSCFHSLMYQQKRLLQSEYKKMEHHRSKTSKPTKEPDEISRL